MRVSIVLVLGVAALTAGCNFGTSTSPGDGGVGLGFEGGVTAASLTSGVGSGSAASQDFGSVQVGHQSAAASIVVTNSGAETSGALAVSLTGADASSFGIDSDACSGHTLSQGQTCSVAVHFLPASAGAKSGSLSVDASPGGATTVALTGAGTVAGGYTITPATQDFGTVALGASSQPTTFTVKTLAATSHLTMSLTGSNAADFKIGTDGCSAQPVAAGGTCTVGVTFSPTSGGAKTASLQASDGTLAATSSLSGTATGGAAFSVTPITYDFGSLSDGLTSSAQTFTVKNTGGVTSGKPTVTLGGTNQGDFVLSSNGCGAVLAAGATCTFGITFKPSTTASELAIVAVAATATTSGSASVSGTGLAPAPIAFSPTTQDFGTELANQASADFTFTLTNSAAIATGPVAVTLTGTDASQFALSAGTCTVNGVGVALQPSGSCTVGVHFKPDGTLPAGPAQATLQATATPGGTTAAALTGTITTPTALVIAPTSQGFGTVVQKQTSGDFPFLVTNNGGVTSGPITVALGGTNAAQFALGTDGCSTNTLAGGTSCTVNVHFAPGAAVTGLQNATLSVGDAPTDTPFATLTGTAATAASLGITAPASFTGFGPAANPTVTPDVAFIVTNNGGVTTGALAVALGGANAGQFALGTETCTGKTLDPAATCTVNVHFAPTGGTVGNEQGTLTVTGTPGGSAPLSFVGIAAKPATFVIQPPSGFQGFGAVSLTRSSAATFTLQNTGGVTSGLPAITSPSADFVVSAGTPACTTALKAQATCGFVLTFTPSSPPTSESSILTASGPGTVSGTYTATGSGGLPTLVISGPTAGYTGFGTIAVGDSASATFSLKNTGPVDTLAAPGITSSYTDYVVSSAATLPCTGVLKAGASCNFVVTFTPSGTNPSDSATLTASVTPGNGGTFSLTSAGAEAVLSISPPSGWPGFGTVEVDQSVSATFTVTNTGAVATRAAPSVNSSKGHFAVSPGPLPCSAVLAINGTCNFVLTFTPTAVVTTDSSTLTAAVTLGTTGTYQVSGSAAVPTLAVIPPSAGFGFGYVTLTESSSATFQVQNNGPVAAAGAPSITSSNPTLFVVSAASTNPCTGTLGVGATCNFVVTYKPAVLTTDSSVLTASSAPANAGTYTVSGQGATGGLGKIAPWFAGNIAQGQSASTTYTMTNNGHGKTNPLTISGFTAGGAWSLANDKCSGVEVSPTAPNNTCTFDVVFAPTLANTTPGTNVLVSMTIADSSYTSDQQSTTLSGLPLSTGYYLVITSNPAGFGTVSSGPPPIPSTLTLTITNYGVATAPAFDGNGLSVKASPQAVTTGFTYPTGNCPSGANAAGLTTLAKCTQYITYTPPTPKIGMFSATVTLVEWNRSLLPFTATFNGDSE